MGLFGNNETITTTFAGKDNLSPVVRGIRTSMDKFRRDLTDFTRKGGLQNALLGGVGLGAGLSAFSAISAGVGLVTGAIETSAKVLMQAARAAEEDRVEQERLARSLDQSVQGWRFHTDAINDAIAAGEKQAFTDTETREAIALLALRTHDVEEATRLWAGAQDVARAKNINGKQAAEAFSKALGGQTKALKSLGFDLKGAVTGTQAIERAMDQAEGAASDFADTAQGKLQVAIIGLNEELETTGRSLPGLQQDLGVFAVNTTTGVLQFVNQVAAGFNRLTGGGGGAGILPTLLAAFKKTGGGIGEVNANWRVLASAFEHSAKGAFEEATNRARDLAGAMEMVADGFRTTDRAWKRLIATGDGNKRAVKELDAEIQKWSRRYRRAVRQNDSEAAAVAARERDRAIEERRQRQLVIDQTRTARRVAVAAEHAKAEATRAARRALRSQQEAVKDLRRELEKLDTMPNPRVTVALRVASEIPGLGGIGNYMNWWPLGPDNPRRRSGPGRASGGPVRAGEAYTVGERGPETLVMGNQSGHIVPNGGSDIVLQIDGEKLFRWVMRRQGREALRSMTG